MEQVTVFLQSVKSPCQQPTLASITLPQTKQRNPLVLLMRYEKDPFSDTSGLSRPRVEEERRFQSQRKCMVPQTIRNTSTLVTQVLSLWLKGSPGHVHENLQHYIKTAHGLQPGSSACHGGGLSFATPPDASRGLSHFCMAPTLSTALCKDRNVRGTGQGPTCPHQCPQSPCAPRLV